MRRTAWILLYEQVDIFTECGFMGRHEVQAEFLGKLHELVPESFFWVFDMNIWSYKYCPCSASG